MKLRKSSRPNRPRNTSRARSHRQPESGERTRERILSAALDIIGREGVQGFTVRRVTEAADVNVALVNYHFTNKQALVDETLAHYFRGIMKVFAILDEGDAPPRQS